MSATTTPSAPTSADQRCDGNPDGWRWTPLAVLGGFFVVLTTLALLEALRVFPGGWSGPVGPYGFWPIFPLGFFLLVVLVFGTMRWGIWGPGGRRSRGYPSSARAILEERYARGEISKDQFRQMRRDLDDLH